MSKLKYKVGDFVVTLRGRDFYKITEVVGEQDCGFIILKHLTSGFTYSVSAEAIQAHVRLATDMEKLLYG